MSGAPWKILVTGATGMRGGAVARALLERGHDVRAFTRDRYSPGAEALRSIGVRIRVGDFDNRDTVRAAVDGCDAVFVAGSPYPAGVGWEIRYATTVIDAAREAKVRHVIYASASGASRNTGIPQLESKAWVEEYLRESKVPHTVLRPVMFMEELFDRTVLSRLANGVLALPLTPMRRLQLLAVADLGSMAAQVIESTERYRNRSVDLASDDVDGRELVKVLARVTGGSVRYEVVPIAQIRASDPAAGAMWEWLQVVGCDVDVIALRERVPEVDWHTFERWAMGHDWPSMLGYLHDVHIATAPVSTQTLEARPHSGAGGSGLSAPSAVCTASSRS